MSARTQDELILSAIRMRCANIGASVIAKHLGCSSAYIRAATNRVKAADALESREDVSAAYWDRPATGQDNWAEWGRLPPKAVPTRIERPVITARFGIPAKLSCTAPDTFGVSVPEQDLARMMAKSAAAEMQAYAITFDESEGAA